LEILDCNRLAPQVICGEEKLIINWIKHFHSDEPCFHIIYNLQEISIVEWDHVIMDLTQSLKIEIELVPSDNSSTWSMGALSFIATDNLI